VTDEIGASAGDDRSVKIVERLAETRDVAAAPGGDLRDGGLPVSAAAATRQMAMAEGMIMVFVGSGPRRRALRRG